MVRSVHSHLLPFCERIRTQRCTLIRIRLHCYGPPRSPQRLESRQARLGSHTQSIPPLTDIEKSNLTSALQALILRFEMTSLAHRHHHHHHTGDVSTEAFY